MNAETQRATDILCVNLGDLSSQDTPLLSRLRLIDCGFSVTGSDEWCAVSVQDLQDMREKEALNINSFVLNCAQYRAWLAWRGRGSSILA